MNAQYLKSKFDAGLEYEAYLATDTQKAQPWRSVYEQVSLTPAQRRLIESFKREMPVIVSTGIWCGDCAQQCPLIQRMAEANPTRIRVRYLDRDVHADLAEQIKICGGLRVPTVIFMAEDFEPVSILGDRTLTRYRAVAARQLGPSCPLPGAPVPQDELDATLQDWLNEIERVQLLLRLSGRLREKHGD
ncbi:MAG TPA: thioredoxin family protein [Phycisphaerales bacterium]|nr:thioredoxin family protein [Phycisphaerales bacterium]HRQ76057.1 thioredoxin family protein [Phycisphaerales bacterium]